MFSKTSILYPLMHLTVNNTISCTAALVSMMWMSIPLHPLEPYGISGYSYPLFLLCGGILLASVGHFLMLSQPDAPATPMVALAILVALIIFIACISLNFYLLLFSGYCVSPDFVNVSYCIAIGALFILAHIHGGPRRGSPYRFVVEKYKYAPRVYSLVLLIGAIAAFAAHRASIHSLGSPDTTAIADAQANILSPPAWFVLGLLFHALVFSISQVRVDARPAMVAIASYGTF